MRESEKKKVLLFWFGYDFPQYSDVKKVNIPGVEFITREDENSSGICLCFWTVFIIGITGELLVQETFDVLQECIDVEVFSLSFLIKPQIITIGGFNG